VSAGLSIHDPAAATEHAADPEFRAMLRRSYWHQGDLSHQLREHGQRWVYEFITALERDAPGPRPIVAETRRRLGKSYCALTIATERCLRLRGYRFLYGLPTKEDAKRIVVPNMARVLRACPPELYPRKVDLAWTFPNGSVIEVCGIDSDPDSGRGGGVYGACVDEAGYVSRLDYWIENVLGPQFLDVLKLGHDPIFFMFSTPPRSMSHPFIQKYVRDAKAHGRYLGVRGSDDPDLTEREVRAIEQIVGPQDSVAWRREVEIEHITDRDEMVCPEFLDVKDEIVREFERPMFYYPQVFMDTGFEDYSHALYCTVDFEEQRLLVLGEMRVHYKGPGELSRLGLAREREVFDHDAPHRDVLERTNPARYADATRLELAGFAEHGWKFLPAEKHDRDATIAKLRTYMQQGKIWIDPSCTDLVFQLEHAVWKETPDGARRDWVRNEALGHCDGMAALAYAVRKAWWTKNPFPPDLKQTERFYKEEWVPSRSDRPRSMRTRAEVARPAAARTRRFR